jgi:hypothetical protein
VNQRAEESIFKALNQKVYPMSKLTLQAVEPTATSDAAPLDPFAPENLRLDQSFLETGGGKKLLTTIPVRKPNKQTFFRVRPGQEWREMFPIIDLKDDREEYIVVRELVPELQTEIVYKQLCLAITRQGTLFFLPLRYPGPDGRDMEWWRSLRDHARRAETVWIRVIPNQELGAYECLKGSETLGEPEWPSETEFKFWDLIKIAFREYLVTSLDHPLVKRLRGQA